MTAWKLFSPNLPPFELFKILPLSLFDHLTNWPSILLYNQFLQLTNRQIVTGSGKHISFVQQSDKSDLFEGQYEPMIYLKGEVLTRADSWHDFFNMLIWLTFPKTKSVLNTLQFHALEARKETSRQRTSLENALTVFDENGIIIVSSDETLLQLIKNFKWKELFWKRRDQVTEHLRCFVFGHSLHEKFLTPYVGMTGHAILLIKSPKFFKLELGSQLNQLDLEMSKIFLSKSIDSGKDFHPFPVLGMPGWYPENQQQSFYDNANYFRKARSKGKLASVI